MRKKNGPAGFQRGSGILNDFDPILLTMNNPQTALPSCFACKFDAEYCIREFGTSFPCRDANGNLDPDRLVEALRVLANERPETPIYDKHFWAGNCMDTIVAELPELGFKLIVFTLSHFNEPSEIAYLAAGPLENLVRSHGSQMIDQIEREAAGNARFRFLLSGIWGESSTDPAIWRRIQKAVADGPWIDEDPRTPQGSTKRYSED